jgi:hypothetical protein
MIKRRAFIKNTLLAGVGASLVKPISAAPELNHKDDHKKNTEFRFTKKESGGINKILLLRRNRRTPGIFHEKLLLIKPENA